MNALRVILILATLAAGASAFKAAANISAQIDARAVAISTTRY